MIALLQRVIRAEVHIDGQSRASIAAGVLALVCAERGDGPQQAEALAAKASQLRMFADSEGRMNRSLIQAGGAMLAVPQFTLAADTRRGARPSFTAAAPPHLARSLFEQFIGAARQRIACVQNGVFGADMQVGLINDGPVTFWLRVELVAASAP